MALVLQLTKTSISADCNTLIITDSTGTYNVSTNPGGYGAPNPTRASLYVIFLVNLRLASGRQSVIVPTYNANTASTWTITLAQDGWYECYMFATIPWSSGTTYNLGDIAYDATSNAFYKSLQAGNTNNSVSNAAWWLATVNVNDFAAATGNAQVNAYDVTLNDVELCRSVKCKALALFQAAEQCDCDAPENDFAIQPYEKIRLRIEAALVASALLNYTDAQEFVDDITKLCQKCGCGC